MAKRETLKSFLTKVETKDARKLQKKTPKNKMYGGSNTLSSTEKSNNAGDSVSESLLYELTMVRYEDEEKRDKFDAARNLFKMALNRPDMERQDIINAFIKKLGVTESTATSYYQRLAKEAGITGPGGDEEDVTFDDEDADEGVGQGEIAEPVVDPDTEWDDKNRAGIIRVVPGAHLIYKRQQEDGTFEELWIYKIGEDFIKEIDIRKDILSGTDIPPNKTKSPDGSQSYSITTMGDGQLMSITGLPQ